MNKRFNYEKPSNFKFGIFLCVLLIFLSLYLFLLSKWKFLVISLTFVLICIVITILRPSLLQILNETWFKFGIIIGKIVSPLVLGIIFFGLILPVGIIGKFLKRDVLKLRNTNKNSYWSKCNTIEPESFKDQF